MLRDEHYDPRAVSRARQPRERRARRPPRLAPERRRGDGLRDRLAHRRSLPARRGPEERPRRFLPPLRLRGLRRFAMSAATETIVKRIVVLVTLAGLGSAIA